VTTIESSQSVLGPIQEVASAADIAVSDSSESAQQQGEKETDKKKENDDSGVDPSLGLINTGPVQLKNDLEQPVTSGGMNTMVEDPGPPG
jgi:hypothetical protein